LLSRLPSGLELWRMPHKKNKTEGSEKKKRPGARISRQEERRGERGAMSVSMGKVEKGGKGVWSGWLAKTVKREDRKKRLASTWEGGDKNQGSELEKKSRRKGRSLSLKGKVRLKAL